MKEPIEPPERGEMHDALAVFLGEWRAEGWSYGGPSRETWTSRHTARWHTGEFFLIQDERARTPDPFDTLSVLGVSPDSGRYFAQTYENHGFFRLYDVVRDGDLWTFTGATERARIEFGDGGRKQTINWEWLKDGAWLPLCDRTATKES